MRVQRWVVAAVTAALVAGVGMVAAVPASAASSRCTLVNGATASGNSATSDLGGTYEAGDYLTVTWSSLSAPSAAVTLNVPTGGPVVDSRTGAGSVSYTFPTTASYTWTSALDSGLGTFVVSCGDVPAPVIADEAAIPAWVQAYGRASADDKCIHGWAASWQSWAEPVTGGWVCTRSIPSLG